MGQHCFEGKHVLCYVSLFYSWIGFPCYRWTTLAKTTASMCGEGLIWRHTIDTTMTSTAGQDLAFRNSCGSFGSLFGHYSFKKTTKMRVSSIVSFLLVIFSAILSVSKASKVEKLSLIIKFRSGPWVANISTFVFTTFYLRQQKAPIFMQIKTVALEVWKTRISGRRILVPWQFTPGNHQGHHGNTLWLQLYSARPQLSRFLVAGMPNLRRTRKCREKIEDSIA